MGNPVGHSQSGVGVGGGRSGSIKGIILRNNALWYVLTMVELDTFSNEEPDLSVQGHALDFDGTRYLRGHGGAQQPDQPGILDK